VPVRCPRLLPAGTAMADADPQSSASAARTAAVVKLESELVGVKADIKEVKASIAEVNSKLGGIPADQQIAFADSMGLAADKQRLTVLEQRASDIRSEIKELNRPSASREPTGASSLPHCRILCFPALLRHL
jgi:predicted  nucleic acid-binding Zn-ribbon protein